jgi:hypothetical protein
MVSEAARRTAERCIRREVLVIQDTTVVRSEGGGGDSKAIKDARHVQPAAPGPVAGVVDRRMPDARVAGTIMGI